MLQKGAGQPAVVKEALDKDGPTNMEDTTGVELLIVKTMTTTWISLGLMRRRKAKRLRERLAQY